MKILIITPCFLPVPTTKGGAVENLVQMIADQNEKKGKINIDIVGIWDEEAEKIAKKYNNTKYLMIKREGLVRKLDSVISFAMEKLFKFNEHSAWRVTWKLYTLKMISKIMIKNSYDRVIIENSPFYLRLFKNKIIKEKYLDKLYFHAHNEYPRLYGTNNILNDCKRIISISNYISGKIKRQIDCNSDKIKKLPNCVDTTLFKLPRNKLVLKQLKKNLGINDTDIIVVFAGRLNPEKGFLELMEAVHLIDDKNIRLLMLGDFFYKEGVENPYHRQIAEYENKLGNRIIKTGYIDYDKMPDYYAISDIAVLPSMWEEPAGLTIIESMVMGLPLISTLSGGIPEYVQPEGSILLKKNDELIDNIRKSIIRLAYDEKLRVYMGKVNYSKMRDYSVEQYYLKFLEVIDCEA